jgi:hypothetical protein
MTLPLIQIERGVCGGLVFVGVCVEGRELGVFVGDGLGLGLEVPLPGLGAAVPPPVEPLFWAIPGETPRNTAATNIIDCPTKRACKIRIGRLPAMA